MGTRGCGEAGCGFYGKRFKGLKKPKKARGIIEGEAGRGSGRLGLFGVLTGRAKGEGAIGGKLLRLEISRDFSSFLNFVPTKTFPKIL